MRHAADFVDKAEEFINLIKGEKHLYIQMHNFPDHDAIAAAQGLKILLKHFRIDSTIIYDGLITRIDLNKMVKVLNIDVNHQSNYKLSESDRIIVVDGNKNNTNVTRLKGDQFAVLDHHEILAPPNVEFEDIRPHLGASSTLIFYYLNHFGIDIPKDLATAFMVGLLIDTNKMTRSVSTYDLDVYYNLYFSGDIDEAQSIVRNCISYDDLHYYNEAINRLRIERSFGFSYLPECCTPGLLGIVADFLLTLEEVDFMVICAKNENIINFSVRNESHAWNAAYIINGALSGAGFGGGHSDLAGGYIEGAETFDPDKIFKKFTKLLYNGQ